MPPREPIQIGDGRDPEAEVHVARIAPEVEQPSQVGQRIADRGHLPVDDGDEFGRRRGREHRVVELEVAMDDGSRPLLGSMLHEPGANLVDLRDVAEPREAPEVAHPPKLPFEIPFGLAEALQTRRVPVDTV